MHQPRPFNIISLNVHNAINHIRRFLICLMNAVGFYPFFLLILSSYLFFSLVIFQSFSCFNLICSGSAQSLMPVCCCMHFVDNTITIKDICFDFCCPFHIQINWLNGKMVMDMLCACVAKCDVQIHSAHRIACVPGLMCTFALTRNFMH